MKLLVADDDRVTRELLKEVFEREGYEVVLVESGEQALKALSEGVFEIVLSDIRMLQVGGMAVLGHIQKSKIPSVVILMTGFGNVEGAIGAIQEGAFDYISKPFKLDQLRAVIARAADHSRSLQEKHPEGLPTTGTVPKKTLIGKSPQIVEVYKKLARATLAPSTVLILGESGTGKELVARAIHDNSTRRGRKFIAINCGALTETLLESELFGHVKGAFTGAVAHKSGLLEEGGGGTVFLDEIGDIPPTFQVKLLRVLQEGEYKPVGSVDIKRTDVRVIAATHRDLEQLVEEGKFREDLLYRLKVILIDLPPLRDRMGDLPELASHFLVRYANKISKKISHISDEAMALLQSYAWPGNIRELEHAIERAVTMTKTSVLYPEDFPPEIQEQSKGSAPRTARTSLEEVERSHILQVLEETQYNKSKAAAILGIDRKTLHRKAQRYEIDLKGNATCKIPPSIIK